MGGRRRGRIPWKTKAASPGGAAPATARTSGSIVFPKTSIVAGANEPNGPTTMHLETILNRCHRFRSFIPANGGVLAGHLLPLARSHRHRPIGREQFRGPEERSEACLGGEKSIEWPAAVASSHKRLWTALAWQTLAPSSRRTIVPEGKLSHKGCLVFEPERHLTQGGDCPRLRGTRLIRLLQVIGTHLPRRQGIRVDEHARRCQRFHPPLTRNPSKPHGIFAQVRVMPQVLPLRLREVQVPSPAQK